MRINLLVILLSLSILSCRNKETATSPGKPQIAREYWSNGKLKSETESLNGKAEGLSKNYNQDGVLESVFTFKNGIRQGPGVEYYPTGQLKHKMYYKDGKREGTVTWYYKTGKLFRETPYKDGKTQGLVKTYYEDGKLLSEALYLDGFPGTDLKEYDKNGKLITDNTKIIIRQVNTKPIQGKIMLDITLSNKQPGMTFFRGDLNQGKFLHEGLQKIPEENGVARYSFVVGQQPLRVTASYQTSGSSYRVITRMFDLDD